MLVTAHLCTPAHPVAEALADGAALPQLLAPIAERASFARGSDAFARLPLQAFDHHDGSRDV